MGFNGKKEIPTKSGLCFMNKKGDHREGTISQAPGNQESRRGSHYIKKKVSTAGGERLYSGWGEKAEPTLIARVERGLLHIAVVLAMRPREDIPERKNRSFLNSPQR